MQTIAWSGRAYVGLYQTETINQYYIWVYLLINIIESLVLEHDSYLYTAKKHRLLNRLAEILCPYIAFDRIIW